MKKKILEKILYVSLVLATVYVMLPFAGCNGSSGGPGPGPSSSGPTVTVPSVPTGLAGTPGSTQIDLTWSASASGDATGYRVYRNGAKVGSDITTGTAFSDTGLTANTTYSYEVSAYNGAGESAKSAPAVSVKTTAPPALPTATPKDSPNFTANAPEDANYGAVTAPLAHGSSSPDGKVMMITENDNTNQQGFAVYMLDAQKLIAGTVELSSAVSVNKKFIPDNAGHIAYRSNWSKDGTKIALGDANAFVIMNVADLSADINTDIGTAQADSVHDGLLTADNKYAVFVTRGLDSGGTPGTPMQDTVLQVYDVVNKKRISPDLSTAEADKASVCNSCHGIGSGAPAAKSDKTANNAWGCGMDGEITLNPDGKTYTGKIFVAGEGGHIAVADFTLDPTVPAGKSPITMKHKPYRLTARTRSASTEWMHDVRWDKARDIAFWGFIRPDNSIPPLLHIGSYYPASVIDDSGTSKDFTQPTAGKAGPVYYCASGYVDGYMIQVSMSTPAYCTISGGGYLAPGH